MILRRLNLSIKKPHEMATPIAPSLDTPNRGPAFLGIGVLPVGKRYTGWFPAMQYCMVPSG